MIFFFQALQSKHTADAVHTLCFLLYSLGYMAVICFFGDNVTRKFGAIGDTIGECSWYQLPMKMQKELLTMLIIAQKPVYIQGFSNTHCTLEFLKKVLFSIFPLIF